MENKRLGNRLSEQLGRHVDTFRMRAARMGHNRLSADQAHNADLVLDALRRIHVPGEIADDIVTVYGYRTDVDYL